MTYEIYYNSRKYECNTLKEIGEIVGLSITAVWRHLHDCYNARHKFEGYVVETE